MTLRKGALLALAIVLGAARAASGQTLRDPEPRQGFYISAGGGLAAVAAWDKGQRDATAAGPAVTIHLGEMLTDRWGLGLAIEDASASHQGIATGVAGLTLEAQARLWGHLAAHAGIGMGGASAKDPARVGDESHGTYGTLLTAALSDDLFFTSRRSGGWAVTPALGLRAVPGGDVSGLAGVFTLSITWWSGLPARELR